MTLQKILVCGAGTMGAGIAQVSAQHGQDTYLFDLAPEQLRRAEQQILGSWKGLVDKGRLSRETVDKAIGRLHLMDQLAAVGPDLVIEAIVEKMDAKIRLFQSLSGIISDVTMLATNTSSLSIGSLQQALPGPERIAGMHFFNPAPVMPLVEIVCGPQTSETVIASLSALARAWGKVPAVCTDAPGFIVNRVARPYYLEALRMAEAGIADYATIDRIAEASGFRMGPFKLMDLIGNDINLSVSRSLYDAFDQALRFQPSPIQEEMVAKGDLGRKTGRGYYTYS
jgi:3-hydroxybutyryl-CoA dehydrogenase